MSAPAHPNGAGKMLAIGADLVGLESSLIAQARRLATAHAAIVAQKGAPDRWRKAALLWPLFVQE